MLLSFKYKEFMDSLQAVASLYKDRQYKDDLKNVFLVGKEGKVFSYASSTITFLEMDLTGALVDTTVDIEDFSIGVRLSSLQAVLSGFTTLSKTEVTKVVLEPEGEFLKVMVHEEPLDKEKDARLSQVSVYRFPLIRVPGLIDLEIAELTALVAEPASEVEVASIVDQLELFYPLLSNAGKGYYIFPEGEDTVYSVFTTILALAKNKSPLTNLKLDKVHIDFLVDVLPREATVSYYRVSKDSGLELTGYVYGNIRLMIKSNNAVGVKQLRDIGELKDVKVELDKCYFQDVLRRVSGNIDMVLDFKNSLIMVSSKNFNQEVPITVVNDGGLESTGFQVPVDVIQNMVLHAKGFGDVMEMCLTVTGARVEVQLKDVTNSWYTFIQGLRKRQ